MKVRTVGALAALSMLLTSYSVWSLTGDEAGNVAARPTATHSTSAPAGAERAVASSGAGPLHLEARLGNARLPGDTESETFVLVSVRADANAAGQPSQRHLTIAIDRSGSMRGERLRNALAAAEGAVERLADGDFVSVIDYAGSARVLVPTTELDAGTRPEVMAQIRGLSAGGDTCISCALETSLQVLGQGRAAVERVLLLSDGEATTGVRDVAGMRRLAETVRATGATVTTIGVDVDYNEHVMTAIAEAANGRHYFVADPSGLPRIFDRELSGLERSVAREASVELELAPGVELVELRDRSFRRDGTRVTVPLGSLAAGEERSVLARVHLSAGTSTERAVATARLTYTDLGTGAPAEASDELVAELTTDGSRSPLDPEVEERVERSGTVTALNDASRLFEAGDATAARERVTRALADVQRGHAAAVAAAPAPKKAALARAFDKEEAALGAAATAFAEPPPASAASPAELRRSKAALKQNAERAADFAF